MQLNGQEQTRQVVRIVRHPLLKARNDYALLQVDQPFTFNSQVLPINFPKDNGEVMCVKMYGLFHCNFIAIDHSGAPGLVYGWGLTWDGVQPDTLRKVGVNVLAKGQCQDQTANINPEKELCAVGVGSGEDSCQGDSGGTCWANLPSILMKLMTLLN